MSVRDPFSIVSVTKCFSQLHLFANRSTEDFLLSSFVMSLFSCWISDIIPPQILPEWQFGFLLFPLLMVRELELNGAHLGFDDI